DRRPYRVDDNGVTCRHADLQDLNSLLIQTNNRPSEAPGPARGRIPGPFGAYPGGHDGDGQRREAGGPWRSFRWPARRSGGEGVDPLRYDPDDYASELVGFGRRVLAEVLLRQRPG